MRRTLFFFLIIFVEGYVVLATELLAMRQLVPFVGNGTETIAIIIAAVLMPLAVGYYQGGRFKRHSRRGIRITVREKLIRNLINATLILSLGLSYILLEVLFSSMTLAGLENRVIQATLYCLLFIVYPVYLLGQTVPLVSNFFSQQRLSTITGRMLCFSTLGSFAGSIISTLVFMTFLGVHNTVILTITLMVFLVFLLSRKKLHINLLLPGFFLLLVVLMNNNLMMQRLGIISNNNYNMVVIEDKPEINGKKMLINRSASSLYAPDSTNRFSYLQYIEKHFTNPILNNRGKPKEILVIGAGGFTVGLEDTYNHYTFIDIDPDLRPVSEAHFLPSPLTDNKKFIAQPARAFIKRSKQQYDFILLDAYTNVVSIPFQLITQEFFTSVKGLLAEDGIFAANIVASPNFSSRFSVKIDRTLRTVFPLMHSHVMQEYNGWEGEEREKLVNMLYVYYAGKDSTDDIYTDDKNSYFLDH